jgi:hypothetical protein
MGNLRLQAKERASGVYVNPNTPREMLPSGLNSYAYSPYSDFSGVTVSSFAGNSHYDAWLSRTLCSQAANCEYPRLLSYIRRL